MDQISAIRSIMSDGKRDMTSVLAFPAVMTIFIKVHLQTTKNTVGWQTINKRQNDTLYQPYPKTNLSGYRIRSMGL